ncbi:septum site-determining protein MinC [Alkalimonas sp. MEB108]|uniref:Probable septum site-determining protein MinC n=1 Tax=Alkalimonas cellulosilytica TaxID=3058395 RepID=A0ABU7J095_9GAMM|nr:septum site-determining protein MinC [Alkalimonas sp. MEB108]MEE1999919.1 septum site-determining protein MinC [Alkalimonas sp. MEB108]
MSEPFFELKGSLFTLSVIHSNDLSVAGLQSALQQKLDQAPGFFHQAAMVIQLTPEHQSLDFNALKQLFQQLKLVLVGVTGATAEQKQQAQAAGLAVLRLGQDSKPVATPSSPVDDARVEQVPMQSKLVEQTIRSGQQIYAKGADLIVRGSVGAGAEVIADGNIHIYGTLRGKAIAGASGDTSKRIFCHHLQAELVSIAGHYWLSDSLQGEYWNKAACIRMQDNSIAISEL